jgi:hypothetical protein
MIAKIIHCLSIIGCATALHMLGMDTDKNGNSVSTLVTLQQNGDVSVGNQSSPFNPPLDVCVNTWSGNGFGVSDDMSDFLMVNGSGTYNKLNFSMFGFTPVSWCYSQRLNMSLAMGWMQSSKEITLYNVNYTYYYSDNQPQVVAVNMTTGVIVPIKTDIRGGAFLKCACSVVETQNEISFYWGFLDEQMENQLVGSLELITRNVSSIKVEMNTFGVVYGFGNSLSNGKLTVLVAGSETYILGLDFENQNVTVLNTVDPNYSTILLGTVTSSDENMYFVSQTGSGNSTLVTYNTVSNTTNYVNFTTPEFGEGLQTLTL